MIFIIYRKSITLLSCNRDICVPWPGRIGGFESVGEDGPSLTAHPPRTKSQRLQPFSVLRLGVSTRLSSLSSPSINTFNYTLLLLFKYSQKFVIYSDLFNLCEETD